MKRIASILFLSILLFNLYGYQLLINCFQQKNEAGLEKRLDNNEFENEDLISIKTPLNLPYSSNSLTYERVYGSVTVKGVDYEYVKRRVYNDTLELLCVPNNIKSELQAIKNDFVKISLECPQSNKKSSGHGNIKIGLPDYYQDISSFTFQEFCTSPITPYLHKGRVLNAGHSNPEERPPQTI